ncbi:MAG TPA: ATP synthase F1 subunit epsilon [Candidatus Hypogeohydataceae bacterium YC41]
MAEKTFKLEVLSPERPIYRGDVISIMAEGTEGFLGVLYGHAPLLTGLEKGRLKVEEPGEKVFHLAIEGGFMEVKQNQVTILTEAASIEGGN